MAQKQAGQDLANMPSGDRPEAVHIAGVRFAALTMDAAVRRLQESVRTGRAEWLLTPNTSIVRRLSNDPASRRLVEPATLVVPDGQPLLWLARLQGTPVPERVTGSGLLPRLMSALPAGTTVGFLGGPAGAAASAAGRAGDLGLRPVGHLCPPVGFDKDPQAWAEAQEAVARWGEPKVVVLGLPFPLQEKLIVALREANPLAVYIGVGAGMSYFAGVQTRASPRLQRVGLEWLWRLIEEPRRLARRYLLQDLPFLIAEGVKVAARRCRTARRRPPAQ